LFKTAHSQVSEKPSADELFDMKNYIEAIDEFKKLEKEFPEDLELKHRLATCYLNIYSDKSQAIPYLEFCYKNEKYKNELLLEMAKAYQFAYRLDDAISFYNKYREKAASKMIPLIDHYIETCENAKELIKKPVNVSFENVGKEINTKYADYYPFVTKDEETLFFTSRRDQNTGRLRSYNGYYTSDVYTSKVEKGVWTRAKNMGALINTSEDEECVGISPDGKNLIVYVDNVEFPGDLFHAEMLKSKQFSKTTPFNEPVNSDQLDAEACYGSDNNTLFFVSARKGGLGEEDIYMSNRLPNGEWGTPKNLGATINTPYREAFPVVSEDGKTLFFSSQGHTSMGGYDIFRSRWDENAKAWSKPINVGYPLNTTDDDMMFSVAKNGRDGYISAWRKEGLGDLDIYKITFNDVDKPLTAISGMVILSDTTKQEIEAFVSITNLKTKVELDGKNVNKKTGKYIFIVEPGKYQLVITSSGNKTIKEDFIVYDKSDFTSLIEKKHLIGGQEQPVIVDPKKNKK
jgi:cell fate (sporulation/competence/biofilm development) regulator YmcA (YheA/YmcA/DUF963 family)